ncbi:GGDEF domain-containing protein [Tibeticola sp.]|uniref:GGDEF domain-containing protein n=1 Tax=Tibeticola sp. TaxID=2005368 RepID=UPI002588006A|nr:GGDEF domain-containing protein [Tibeticola sp.]MCI4440159.1 GGDEF domain-containing protein [Tibeticola sp.]
MASNSEPSFTAADPDNEMLDRLLAVIQQRTLTAVFQPIISMGSGEIFGYEGLIRGPSDSPLHAPASLFGVAAKNGLNVEVELLCREVVLERFMALQLPGKLFLNVSPDALVQPNSKYGETIRYIQRLGINPDRVVIELTENQATQDYKLLREAVMHYRAMGFRIAIDDLGEGFSSLRLWSELRPEYVKIDMHFVQGINQDPVKLQFVRSIQRIAEESGSRVIAEGIETQAELLLIKDLGIAYGQGYHIARPNANPALALPAQVADALGRGSVSVYPHGGLMGQKTVSAMKLLRAVPAVTPETHNETVFDMFVADPDLLSIPVVKNAIPVGLINRYTLIDRFARVYFRELHGKRPCSKFMDASPLVVDKNISIQELSNMVVQADRHHLLNGFIITDGGAYLGMGTGHDLMREITQMQIDAARYANPLTLLPGNVPINEHIDRLIDRGVPFCACYCDLDHFKPFNDVYGYRKGDDMIQLTGRVLAQACDPNRDFIGHIGGDDFVILFQSQDWEARCRAALDAFSAEVEAFFTAEDRERGGYVTEDRLGRVVFHPLTCLSIGAVKVEPGQYKSHHEIAAAAADAKKQAKRMAGNSLFVERRSPGGKDQALALIDKPGAASLSEGEPDPPLSQAHA